MDIHSLAALLGGREYLSEITKKEEKEAKASGLVVVFGASDDLVEFRGAIDNELGAYEGITAYLTSEGLLTNECEDDECPYFEKLQEKASTIKAIFGNGGYTWTFDTAIPHAVFDILEDGGKYCRGIVFELARVP
jgi:hypothetical protein